MHKAISVQWKETNEETHLSEMIENVNIQITYIALNMNILQKINFHKLVRVCLVLNKNCILLS